MTSGSGRHRLVGPLVLLGVGLGGFVDGIVLHQILQLHHMVSNAGDDAIGLGPQPVDTVAGLETNTVWDGLFHAGTYVAVVVALWWGWRRWMSGPPVGIPGRIAVGGLLLGWGGFNVVEGVVNHHVLRIHHVVSGDWQLFWDLAFLGSGLALAAVGLALLRVEHTDADAAMIRD